MYPSSFTQLIPLLSLVAVVIVLWAVWHHSRFCSVFLDRNGAEEYRQSKTRQRTSDYHHWMTRQVNARAMVFGRAWIPKVSRTCHPLEVRLLAPLVYPRRIHLRRHHTPSRIDLPRICPRSRNGVVTRCYFESPKSRSAVSNVRRQVYFGQVYSGAITYKNEINDDY